MHCPHTRGLIKGRASYTPSFYSPCLLRIQGDKIHKTKTMTSLCEDEEDRAGTFKKLWEDKSGCLSLSSHKYCDSPPEFPSCMSGGFSHIKTNKQHPHI